MKEILVLAINYSNENEVIAYAKMLSQQTIASKIGLIITNNRCSDDKETYLVEQLQLLDIDVFYYNPHDNLGYLSGCFYGYNKYIESTNETPQWVFISNTDIMIDDEKFFEKMLNNSYDENTWCIAPSVYSPTNNSYDNPHYKQRHKLTKIKLIIWIYQRPLLAFIHVLLAKVGYKVIRRAEEPSQFVYSVHGCFFGLRNIFIHQISESAYQGFLYSEEAYIAELLRLKGKQTYYDSSLKIIHNENSVTGMLNIKKKAQYIASSMIYIKDTFFSTS